MILLISDTNIRYEESTSSKSVKRGYIRALRHEVILKGAKHTPFLSDCFYHTKKNKKEYCSINNLKARPKFPGLDRAKCLLKENERMNLQLGKPDVEQRNLKYSGVLDLKQMLSGMLQHD